MSGFEKMTKAIILAAGKGTRMQSVDCDLPKVMRLAAGRPLLAHVLEALSFLEPRDTIIVVGYKKEQITQAFAQYCFAEQLEQKGTGHAVMAAFCELEGFGGDLVACCGDMPLIRRETYLALIETHRREGNSCTILSGTTPTPLPYGRIIRGAGGEFAGIVEDKDCTDEQKQIRELNSGVYVFGAPQLKEALSKLENNNSQGEYYLTDAPQIIKDGGGRVGVCMRELGDEIIGVNTPEQLLEVEVEIRARLKNIQTPDGGD